MASWADVEREAPAFAKTVRERFDAHVNKLLATLRADGAPRISAIEADFRDGELWLGMMTGSRKAADLRRDPRLALHAASEDPGDAGTDWADAKLSGRGVEITERDERRRLMAALGAPAEHSDSGHLFRVDVQEVVLTRLGGDPPDHLVIELWRPGSPLRRVERR